MINWITIGVLTLMVIGLYSVTMGNEIKRFKDKNEDDNEVKYVKRPLSSSDYNIEE